MSPNKTAAIRWMPLASCVRSPHFIVVGAPLIGWGLGLGVGLSEMAGISNNQFESSLNVRNVGVVSGLRLC